jgi:hypothetical protein
MNNVPVKELVLHYTLASKGSMERAMLLALDAGYEFARVVGAMGDEGVRVAWRCLLNGWIDRGQITDEGRAHLQKGSDS